MPTRMPDWWTVPYPELTTVKAASAYIDAIGGSLSRAEENGWWVLSTGTQELVRAATPAELDTFVLGFALAHLICERHGPIARTEPAVAAAPPPPPAPPAPPVAVAATPVSTEASPPPPPPPPVAAAAEAGELDEDDGEPEHTTTLSVVPDVDDEDGTDLETPAGSPFERGFESGFDEDEEEEEGDLGDEPSMSAAPPLGRSSGRRRRRRR